MVVIARALLLGRAAVLVAFDLTLLGPRLLLVPKMVLGVKIMLLPAMAFAHGELPWLTLHRHRFTAQHLHTALPSVEQQVRLKTRKIRSGRLPEFELRYCLCAVGRRVPMRQGQYQVH